MKTLIQMAALLTSLALPSAVIAQGPPRMNLDQEAGRLKGFESSNPDYAMLHRIAIDVELPTFIENQSRPLFEAMQVQLLAANPGKENEVEQFIQSARVKFTTDVQRLSVRAVSSALPSGVDPFKLANYAKSEDGKHIAALLRGADALCFQLPLGNKLHSCTPAQKQQKALNLDAHKDRRTLFDMVTSLQRSALAFIMMGAQERDGFALMSTWYLEKANLKAPQS